MVQLALELLALHKHQLVLELLDSLVLLKAHKVLKVQVHLEALLVLRIHKDLPVLRPQVRLLVLKVLKVLDSHKVLKVPPPQVHQVLLKAHQVLNSPKDPVCPHHQAHLLNPLDPKDLVLLLDQMDLALLHLHKHLRVQEALMLLLCLERLVLHRDLVLPSDRDSQVHPKDQVDL